MDPVSRVALVYCRLRVATRSPWSSPRDIGKCLWAVIKRWLCSKLSTANHVRCWGCERMSFLWRVSRSISATGCPIDCLTSLYRDLEVGSRNTHDGIPVRHAWQPSPWPQHLVRSRFRPCDTQIALSGAELNLVSAAWTRAGNSYRASKRAARTISH